MNRAEYNAACKERWRGPALVDAKENWDDWQELHDDLKEKMREFHRNPFLKDVSGKCHNSNGNLSAFLWKLQEAWEPDRSRLSPFLDFEENFQRCFLRRGLIIYCTGLLRELESEKPNDEHPDLFNSHKPLCQPCRG